jgi:general stress protein 26
MAKRRQAAGQATRPRMPAEYGILSPRKGKGLLPWSWAAHRLAKSRGHWIATTRPDGSPHVMIVWGVWLEDAFYFGTSKNSRKARNLGANPHCVVCTERADEAVILEGVAQAVSDAAAIKRFAQAYRKKYEEEIDTQQFPVHAVRPRTVFGFVSTAEAWAGTATRWQFK